MICLHLKHPVSVAKLKAIVFELTRKWKVCVHRGLFALDIGIYI